MADHLFFSEVGEGSVERTVLIMLWHVKEANQLIQAKVGYTACMSRGWHFPKVGHSQMMSAFRGKGG